MPLTRTEPFPATLRSVSGSKAVIWTMTRPARIARVMNMERNPQLWDKAPPITGPTDMLNMRTKERTSVLERVRNSEAADFSLLLTYMLDRYS